MANIKIDFQIQDLAKMEALVQQLQTTLKGGGNLTQATQQAQQAMAYKKQALQLTEQEKELNKQITREKQLQAKVDVAELGSYDKMNALLNQLIYKQKQLNLQTKEGQKEWKENQRLISQYDAKLKQLDAQMGRHQRNVGNYTGAIKEGFAKIGLVVGGVLAAYHTLNKALGASVEAAMEWESAQKKLFFATGQNVEVTERLIKTAERYHQTTLFTKEQISDAYSYALSLGRTEDQTQKMVIAAMGLSRVTGKDVNEAMAMLSSTMEGVIRGVSRYDGRIKELTPEQLKMGGAIDLLSEKLGKFVYTGLSSTEGKLVMFKKQIKEVQEYFGNALLRLIPFNTELKTHAQNLQEIQIGMNAELDALKDGNYSQEIRKDIINKINTEYGIYLPRLITEKDTIKQIGDLQKIANDQMEQKIYLSMYEEDITKLLLKKRDAMFAVYKAQVDFNAALKSGMFTGREEELSNFYDNLIGINKTKLKDIEVEISNLREKYKSLGKGLDISLDNDINKPLKELTEEQKKALKKAADEMEKGTEDLNEQLLKLEEDYIESNLSLLDKEIFELAKVYSKFEKNKYISIEQLKKLEELYYAGVKKIREKNQTEILRDEAKFADELIKLKKEKAAGEGKGGGGMSSDKETERQKESIGKRTQMEIEAGNTVNEIKVKQALEYENTVQNSLTTISNLYEAQKNRELQKAGNDERKREEIEKKYFERQKRLAMAEAIIDGASAIMKTYVYYKGWNPIAIAAAIAQGAVTLSQLAVISSTKFAEGEIDIHRHGEQKDKDSIPALIMPGESVIPTRRTKKYKSVLQDIMDDKFDEKYIHINHTMPELNREVVAKIEKASGYDSQKIIATLDDYEQRRKLERLIFVTEKNNEKLIYALKNQTKRR